MKALTFALVVSAFGAYFANYINRSTPDERYSLSERIPVSFGAVNGKTQEGTTPEVVQQLDVKNIGTLKSDNILSKIRGDIKSHLISKHSGVDDPKITAVIPRSFEVLYPGLPPGGGFQLSFKSQDGVAAQDVSVFDSHGQAREALSKSSTGPLVYAIWIMLAVMWIQILWSLQGSIVDLWKSSSSVQPIADVIMTTKPWYMNNKMFTKAKKEAVMTIIRNGIRINVAEHPAFGLLRLDKPEHFSDDEWKACVDLAVNRLRIAYSESLATAFSKEQILSLLQIERPKLFPETDWRELEDKANRRYIEICKPGYSTPADILKLLRENRPKEINPEAWATLTELWQKYYVNARFQRFDSEEAVIRKLREKKPPEIAENFWDDLSSHWENQYFGHVMDGLVMANDVEDYYKTVQTDLLSASHKDWFDMRFRSYQKSIQAERQRYVLKDQFELLYKLTNDAINSGSFPASKPNGLDELQWASLLILGEQLKKCKLEESVALENSDMAAFLTQKEHDLQSKYDIIDRQLKFIHDVLNDPTAVDRVEAHDTTFSRGNLDNLKKMALAISRPKKSGTDRAKGTQ